MIRKILIGIGLFTLLLFVIGLIYVRQLISPQIKFGDNFQVDLDYNRITYPFFAPNPFHEDIMWISTYYENNNRFNNRKQYLFDMKQNHVIATSGRYTDAITSKKHNLTLISQLTDWRTIWRGKVERWLDLQPTFYSATYRLYLMPHESKSFLPLVKNNSWFDLYRSYYSPDYKYIFCHAYTQNSYKLIVIDLETKNTIDLPDTTSFNSGWWSNTEILMHTNQNEKMIYNVVTGEQELIYTPEQLQQFVNENNLFLTDPNQTAMTQIWDGSEYQFLIISRFNKPMHPNYAPPNPDEDWIFKLNKNTKKLEIFTLDFPHHYLGKWNTDLSNYVYTSKIDDNTTELMLYDKLSSNSRLVLPEDTPLPSWSMPSFYHDQIVFASNKNLWIVNQDGSGLRQLFPPENQDD